MAWSRTDDLDGTPAAQSLFAFDGQMYTIDLNETNLARMRKALQPFLTVAQPYGEMPRPDEFEPTLEPAVPGAGLNGSAPTPATNGTKNGTRRKAAAQKAPTPVKANGKPDFGLIRVWANANGYTVGPTGRIPQAILDAYETQTSAL